MRKIMRRRSVGVGLALVAVSLAAQIVVGATAAEARCANGIPTRSTLGSISTNPVLEEEPYKNGVSTCDGNRTYSARIRAIPGSGSANNVTGILVYVQNNANWTLVREFTGVSAGVWYDYSYADDNNSSWLVFCWRDRSAVRHCGWGTNVDTSAPPAALYNNAAWHGVNSGY